MKDYLSLLLNFQALPRIRRSSTFMEIAGYPHYENVCSNILGFYFDPQAEHGLGNMLLNAFLRMVKQRTGVDVPNFGPAAHVTVTREYPAENNKRIDLVIDAENFTLGIENKIYHWEANDFENYARVIEEIGSNKTTIKAVLCLRTQPNQAPPKGGFLRYTYCELWQHVRDLLGHHISAESTKWMIYLNDFMSTTTRLTGETQNEKEVTEFFMKHHALIESLVNDRQQLLNRLASRLKYIEGQVKEAPEFAKYRTNRGLCGPYLLASHFGILGRTIGMDFAGDMSGWQLQLWDNGSAPFDVLHRLAKSEPMQNRFPDVILDGHFKVLQRWDLHVDELQLLQAVTTGYSAMIAAADSITSVHT